MIDLFTAHARHFHYITAPQLLANWGTKVLVRGWEHRCTAVSGESARTSTESVGQDIEEALSNLGTTLNSVWWRCHVSQNRSKCNFSSVKVFVSGIYFLLFLHAVQKRKQSWKFIWGNNLLSVSLRMFWTKLEFHVVFKEASQSD